MGQFTQQDPIGLAGGMNLYGYAGGDPINFSDPFGLCPEPGSEGDTGEPCFDGPGAVGMVLFGAINTGGRTAQRVIGQAAGALRHARGVRAAGKSAFAHGAPTAADDGSQGAIDQLFRAGDDVPGGTAGAVRYEIVTGQPLGGKFHGRKASERIAHVSRLIRSGKLGEADQALAQRIVDDLDSALNSGRPQ